MGGHRDAGVAKEAHGIKVKDVMTHDVVTVSLGATLKQAARLLVEHKISGLPVVDVDGRAPARSDAEIATDIRELVVKHLLVHPKSLEIEVRDGEVTLGGALENDADIEVLPKLVARIPGVVDVRSALVSPYGVLLTKSRGG